MIATTGRAQQARLLRYGPRWVHGLADRCEVRTGDRIRIQCVRDAAQGALPDGARLCLDHAAKRERRMDAAARGAAHGI